MNEEVDVAQAIAEAERVEQLKQRARSFCVRRDRYLEPIVDPGRAISQVAEDQMEDVLGFEPPFEGFQEVYRPKDGDHRNLQLFASSLVQFAYEEADREFGLFLFLALPQGGLVLLTWVCSLPEIEDVVLNGASYKRLIQDMVWVKSLDSVTASLFLPPDDTIEQHETGLDTLLSFMTSLLLPKNVCLREPQFILSGWDVIGGAPAMMLPGIGFRTLLDAVILVRSELHLQFIQLSEEQCQLLQSTELHHLAVSYDVVRGTPFLRQTPTADLYIWDLTTDDVCSAFTDLGMRQKPIYNVIIGASTEASEAFVFETTADVDILLGGLVGVENLTLDEIKMTPPMWHYFWRRMEENNTLFSLEFGGRLQPVAPVVGEEVGGDDDLWWLRAVADCLDKNWFLQSILFAEGLLDDKAQAFWQAEVVPLLMMNASDVPRLPSTKRRRLDVHDAIIRVKWFPDKVLGLVKDNPVVFYPIPVRAQPAELLQLRREDQATQAAPQGMSNRLIAKLQRQIQSLQEWFQAERGHDRG